MRRRLKQWLKWMLRRPFLIEALILLEAKSFEKIPKGTA